LHEYSFVVPVLFRSSTVKGIEDVLPAFSKGCESVRQLNEALAENRQTDRVATPGRPFFAAAQ